MTNPIFDSSPNIQSRKIKSKPYSVLSKSCSGNSINEGGDKSFENEREIMVDELKKPIRRTSQKSERDSLLRDGIGSQAYVPIPLEKLKNVFRSKKLI